MPGIAKGARNAMWKGGRTVASNGYVLIRVGTDHHLADVRGYAYEHRLVAEMKIGRRLQSGEQVHHIDGNKQNNCPDNLHVVAGMAEHRLLHRIKQSNLRMPGEVNPAISCACGCGATFSKFDSTGRPRLYVTGHNRIASPSRDAIRAALLHGPRCRCDLSKATGIPLSPLATALSKMKAQGIVAQVRRGVWGLIKNG